MVELRKRPPRNEPPAPPPAAKKGRAAATTNKAKVTKAPAKKESGVAAKAKAAASKVKEAVAGPSEPDNSAKQPTVEDESLVETGEAGMIPETAGTAPSTTTVPAEAPAQANANATDTATPATEPAAPTSEVAMADAPTTAAGEQNAPPATDDLENPPETGKVEPAAPSTLPAAPGDPTPPHPTATLPLSADSVGKQIPDLSTFGGTVETHTSTKVSVSDLLAQATSSGGGGGGGIIIFTYPKASTPGCTTQACSFRDHHAAFTGSTGYKVFGLSGDSAKANAAFAAKQKLQYPLLCDPAAALTGALGMKKAGNAKGTLRGVVVIDAQGIVKVWFQGGPAKTVDVVSEYLATVQ